MRNKVIVLIFIIGYLIPQCSFASRRDSLKQLLLDVPEKEKAEIYNQLYKLGNNNKAEDSTLFYVKNALSLSKKYKIEYQEGLAYKNLGQYYIAKNELDKAIDSFNKAIMIFKKINHYKRLIYTYHDLAHAYSNKNKYIKASEYLYKALEISEKNQFTQGTIDILNGIGLINRILGEYDKALEHLNKALYLEKGSMSPDKKTISKLLSNIGLTHWNKKEYDKALEYFQEELKYQVELKNERGIMMANTYMGIVYGGKKEYENSLYYYENALQHAEIINSEYLICAAEYNIGETFWFLKKYKRAILMLKKALNKAKKLNHVEWQRNASMHIFECYEKLGDYKNAFHFFEDFHDLNDSLQLNESKFKLADLETKYKTEKKEKQIKFLNQEVELKELKLNKSRNVLFFSISIFVLLLLSAIGYFLYLRQKQKNQEIVKKQLYEKQLFATIISTEDKERKRFASDLHDGLGPLLSSVKLYLSSLKNIEGSQKDEMIDYANKLIDESIRSVRIISNNIIPVELTEKGLIPSIISFRNKIQHSTNINIKINDNTNQQKLELSNELILYRVIQELINNSIKHSEADKISIKFNSTEKDFLINYKDNGKGFDIDKQLKEAEGIGLQNIYERIGSLQGDLEFTSSKENGTIVKIKIQV